MRYSTRAIQHEGKHDFAMQSNSEQGLTAIHVAVQRLLAIDVRHTVWAERAEDAPCIAPWYSDAALLDEKPSSKKSVEMEAWNEKEEAYREAFSGWCP